MNLEHAFFVVVVLWLSLLTWRVVLHRKAIMGLIRLRKDVAAIEAHLTEPQR